jgi:alpha-glucosidase
LGAFYPFYRNHNVDGAIPQEAYRWESVAAAARKAIDLRYKLLDYIYTAMFRQTLDGTPMLAPLWYVGLRLQINRHQYATLTMLRMHYPTDSNTYAIETQFFYGPSLLVNPVTEEHEESVTFYLPKGVWYDLFTRTSMTAEGNMITYFNVPDTDISVLVRGGSIVPMRIESANTTRALRDKAFELVVAPDANGNASGTLYLDDGESLQQAETSLVKFSFDGSKIRAEGNFGFPTVLRVASVTVMGGGGPQTYELDEGFDGAWEVNVGELKRMTS